jgi:hypothetical protein
MKTVESIDKFDVEELIKDFRILSLDNFSIYLREIWRDLAQRCSESNLGVNKITFGKVIIYLLFSIMSYLELFLIDYFLF